MPTETTEYLDQFSVYATHDPDEARELIGGQFGVELIIPEKTGYYSKTNGVRLSSLDMYYSRCSRPISQVFPNDETTHVHLYLHGGSTLDTGARRIDVGAGEALVCSGNGQKRLDSRPDASEIVLSIPRSTLDQGFAQLTGFKPQCLIEFAPQLDAGNPHNASFRELVMLLAARLDASFSVWPKATLEQLERACVTSLLLSNPHNLSHLLQADPGAGLPRHVCMAEHFAEINAERDVNIDEMAKAAAVSVSTLTRAFLKHRGCTPAAFAKRTRLARARELLESRAATTVVGVAMRCGFSNPSRFGREYGEMFGETPTQTLRRLRAQKLDA